MRIFSLEEKRAACQIKSLSALNVWMSPTVRIGGEDACRSPSLCIEAEKAIPSADIKYSTAKNIHSIEN